MGIDIQVGHKKYQLDKVDKIIVTGAFSIIAGGDDLYDMGFTVEDLKKNKIGIWSLMPLHIEGEIKELNFLNSIKNFVPKDTALMMLAHHLGVEQGALFLDDLLETLCTFNVVKKVKNDYKKKG